MKRFRNQKGFTVIELMIVVVLFFIVIGIGGGWVQNLVKLTKCDFEAPYKTEVIRVVGILPPVGGVVGWMDIGEENKGGDDVIDYD